MMRLWCVLADTHRAVPQRRPGPCVLPAFGNDQLLKRSGDPAPERKDVTTSSRGAFLLSVICCTSRSCQNEPFPAAP